MTNPTINSNLKFLNKNKQNDDTTEQADIKAQQNRCSSLVTLPVEAMPKTTTSRPPLLALPGEIKLMVLSEYLPSNKFFVRPDFERNQLHTFDFAKQVLPLLMAIPELKYLVYDVLLKQNKILITTSPRGGIPYPPGWINALIPRLCVRIHMTEEGIQFLRQLATGKLGFEKLVEIDIRLTAARMKVISTEPTLLTRRSSEPLVPHVAVVLKNMESIIFPFKTISVSCAYADNVGYRDSWRDLSGRASILGAFANKILSKISLSEGRTNEDVSERYSCYRNKDGSILKGDEDAVWPYGPVCELFEYTHVLQITIK
ncbi:uncharacterized protein J4E87_003655 [Alternaria ethzedia]|uniref:uncharacterized protein n=1 Tax=Alternaria ethzedia TaxID=181014 RepID=UPI0020C54B17|nr:uncharacterized protein J4E87_003655 [Alternaria ethzedia]KAI4629391.1 hypothetical protein J4E87_003655 [Alternaria ethzedia]